MAFHLTLMSSNAGDAGTAFSGGEEWLDEKLGDNHSPVGIQRRWFVGVGIRPQYITAEDSSSLLTSSV